MGLFEPEANFTGNCYIRELGLGKRKKTARIFRNLPNIQETFSLHDSNFALLAKPTDRREFFIKTKFSQAARFFSSSSAAK